MLYYVVFGTVIGTAPSNCIVVAASRWPRVIACEKNRNCGHDSDVTYGKSAERLDVAPANSDWGTYSNVGKYTFYKLGLVADTAPTGDATMASEQTDQIRGNLT